MEVEIDKALARNPRNATLEQNGVVECKHRHLLDIARAVKLQAYIPDKFWSECILTATYIVNRLPVKKLGGNYEIIHHKATSI